MATILDYLAWRGDLPICDAAPLNELDYVVLSRFSNLPFYDVYHTGEETMGSFCQVMTTFPREPFQIDGDVPFVKAIAESKRFAGLRVTDYIKDNRPELEMQFAAVTIHLPRDILFLSFCGTDSTLLGWKENLNMSFQNDVPAQCAALSYAARAIKMYPDIKGIYMGGHSKGGNLAAYAAVCLPAKYRPIVKGVFSYDGPGFSNSFIAEHAIDEMGPRSRPTGRRSSTTRSGTSSRRRRPASARWSSTASTPSSPRTRPGRGTSSRTSASCCSPSTRNSGP